MDDLLRHSQEKVMTFRHDKLTIQFILPKNSKSIIDRIDRSLGKALGLSNEQIDFVVNYDGKFRMGGSEGGDTG
jgi:hypothetical protein